MPTRAVRYHFDTDTNRYRYQNVRYRYRYHENQNLRYRYRKIDLDSISQPTTERRLQEDSEGEATDEGVHRADGWFGHLHLRPPVVPQQEDSRSRSGSKS